MRTDLPALLTATIGRKQSSATVTRLLQRPDARIVTVTGPGGVGKTRLAIDVATRLAGECAYSGGVVFISLADIRDPIIVLPTIASAFQVTEPAGASLVTALAEHLRDREMLLVLDNLEQVIDAAVALAELTRQCPRLQMLITSRVPLHLQVEREFSLPPLDLPQADESGDLTGLRSIESVALFVERAQQVQPAFELTSRNARAVAAICRLLDGLPLAIELAAARIRVLSPQAMVGHLSQRLNILTGGPRDLPARQRTMRDTIAWSYDLLAPDVQRLLRIVSAFSGGWTIEMAAAIAGSQIDVFEGHAALIDHSLIRLIEQPGGSTRFTMLETIRAFGLEQLATTGEMADTRRTVSQNVAALAVAGEPPSYWAKVPDEWLALLRSEHDNIRSALDWFLESDPVQALRLVSSLYWFWLIRGHLSEGRRWLEVSLAAATDASEAERAKGLVAAGELACWQSDFGPVDALLTESLALYTSLNDQQGIARATYGIARTAMFQDDFATAVPLYEQCLAIYTTLGDGGGLNSTQLNLAVILRATGDLERARELYEICVYGERDMSAAMRMVGLANLCWLEMSCRNWTRAVERAVETLSLFGAGGEIRHAIESMEAIAIVAGLRGHREQASQILSATHAHRKRMAYPILDFDQAEYAELLAEARLQIDETSTVYLLSQAMPIDTVVAEALSLASILLAGVAVANRHQLSPREIDVLRLLVEGKSDRDIAADLYISHHTVMRHVSNILGKLNVDSRTAAATYAVRERLV